MFIKLVFWGSVIWSVIRKMDPERWYRGQGVKSYKGRVKDFEGKRINKGKDKDLGFKWLKSLIWEF